MQSRAVERNVGGAWFGRGDVGATIGHDQNRVDIEGRGGPAHELEAAEPLGPSQVDRSACFRLGQPNQEFCRGARNRAACGIRR